MVAMQQIARLRIRSIASPRVPLPVLTKSTTITVSTRGYRDAGIYGYRTPREYSIPDYTPEELTNRNENATLLRYVTAYRTHGHKVSHLDPLEIQKSQLAPELDPARYGLTDSNKLYNLAGILHVNESKTSKTAKDEATIGTITDHLRKAYSGKIAYEYTHIPNSSERRWFAHMAESNLKRQFTKVEKRRVFELLTRSETFDHFMAKKFTQVKRYGLEGAESMMVALDSLFENASKSGIVDAVVGMPHRGRLNLLADLMQYNATALFSKIKGKAEFPSEIAGSGDVLSHIATSPNLDYKQKKPIRVALLHNPSHLEAVNPVAMGKARAKQMYLFDQKTEQNCDLGDRVLCVQIHGDAAFAGQGVVMESLGLSNLPHFTSGGSVHLIVNNQIGYTTPAVNARSTAYTTDIAKMINAPVIHVNGDHPEDVAWAAKLAFAYRQKFRKDVVLDLVTYRRWGHNELDEPSFTQPQMYNVIRARKSVPKLYEERLLSEGIIEGQAQIEEFRQAHFDHLSENHQNADSYEPVAEHLRGKWSKMKNPSDSTLEPDTGVEVETLRSIGLASVEVPDGTAVHPRLQKFHIQTRLAKISAGKGLDWATAEALAWGSLLLEGHGVRICGQDVGRGTFSQRHAMLVDQNTESVTVPLNLLGSKLRRSQGFLEVTNSNLSELAVLGFEYGMSLETPNILHMWEAQFGDFFNSAQVTIDTFVASGETKWLRQSGLVMLLPHGYDGAGPEHSSCRPERFLQLADDRFKGFNKDVKRANVNWHVCNPTTPAQYFHLLRRQMKRDFRKPLIVIGPKTLLRLPAATSTLEDMAVGTKFQPVLPDEAIKDPAKIKRVVLVSGKLYYDLVNERTSKNMEESVALVRVEELCPFPAREIIETLNRYSNAKDFVWCQEEVQNGGAYSFMQPRLDQILPNLQKVKYVGRQPLAAPATGISSRHKVEQRAVLDACFDLA